MYCGTEEVFHMLFDHLSSSIV